jgi:multiple antibiotic resistance protein
MDQISFIFTILFVLLGPLRIISPFDLLTREMDDQLTRAVALRAALIASSVCLFVGLAGETLLRNYHISLDGLRISAGLVLLLAALNAIFPKPHSSSSGAPTATPIQLAASPIAVPTIVSHAGVAAILIFTIVTPHRSETKTVVAVCLGIIMVLDFFAMYFIRRITKQVGLMLTLQVIGSVLIFIQVALAIQLFLTAFRSLGVINV